MSRPRQLVLVLATAGAGYCLYLLGGFLRIMADNGLPWDGSAPREHYLAVGEAYSRGFVVGFFFCFCLAIIAFVIGSWYEKSVKGKRAGAAATA